MRYQTEFRYNRKRKHYSYIFKRNGDYRKNLLLSTKPVRKVKSKGNIRIIKNIELEKHPNPNSNKKVYVINKTYTDHKNSFDYHLNNWQFCKNDRLKVKRIKNNKLK